MSGGVAVRTSVLLFFAFTWCAAAVADTLTSKVVGVADGDIVAVLDAINVRLQGVVAPERGQPFGTMTREGLASMVMAKTVIVHDDSKDKCRHMLGCIEIDGRGVNRQMVAGGLAWHYVTSSKTKGSAGTEQESRAPKRGLWADAAPVPPWE